METTIKTDLILAEPISQERISYLINTNKIMDNMWHFHILDTRAYVKDCDAVFGHYLHHYPYFGMRGEQDAANLKNSFELTKVKYEEAFNEPMVRDEQMKCWHDCENRCWHKCDDE